ncbi:hypothetical protein I6A60_31235 [Frankia sp. AgB1.9]|uniref:hypothetical protein n=1 Tax=unclassified Frankia TaxID=2632575 RepID=UPI0019337866|nr:MULTISPECIES: hypothetical protein [unclassified Frankia]MBL7493017.1 hypothetical protein [Frankia sp. AgW1.1]MBL7552304.1 hypothetical protein [Frankia sp. AgB1.9]MBL7622057.1 hypothetical protein [Frankia sp. AgB1.8]
MNARTMAGPAVTTELLTPSRAELSDARARIGVQGGAFSASYTALGLAATGLAGVITRSLLSGDVEAAAAALRRLGALDLAAAEQRARLLAADRPADRHRLAVV